MDVWPHLAPEQLDLAPSYNVAPSQLTPVVRLDGEGHRTAAMLKWGLVPFWATGPAIGSKLINARAEEVAGKPAFRAAAKKRRCLVPVDGFYEWKKESQGKRPYLIRVKDVPLFAFAGLWESWGKGEQKLETFTILTGKPNALVSTIHDRMPVIVRPEHYALWLDPRHEDFSELTPVLEPYPAERMVAVPVSTRVNSPKNNDAACIESVAEGPEREQRLFG
jgi:putative SOS response-associated peptidase YedK